MLPTLLPRVSGGFGCWTSAMIGATRLAGIGSLHTGWRDEVSGSSGNSGSTGMLEAPLKP